MEDLKMPLDLLHNKTLSPNQKIYLATYYMCNENILEADRYMYDYNKRQLKDLKKSLVNLGYLKKTKIIPDDLKKLTIQKSHTGLICEWCKKECYILQKHHYPIPAREGGNKVVNICPNCHYTFHALESEIYE